MDSLFHVDKLIQTLPIMGMGMLGIFVVTGVIILCITLLNRLAAQKNRNKDHNG